MTNDVRWIDTADVAKLVRKALRATFPATTFQVRISRYSGGSSIDVRWTDGPSRQRVEDEVGHYCGGRFDGMDDSMHFHTSDLAGERVRYGNGFIQFQRDYSDGFVARVASDLAARTGWWIPPTMNEAATYTVKEAGQYASSLIYQHAENRERLGL